MSGHTVRHRRSELAASLIDFNHPETLVTLHRPARLAISPSAAFSQFIESRTLAGRTEHTRVSYTKVLQLLADYLEQQRDVSDVWNVRGVDLEGWLAQLRRVPSQATGRSLSAYTLAA